MTTRKTKPAKRDENKLTPAMQAKSSVRADIVGAAAMESFNKAMFPDAGLSDLIIELRESIKAVQSGDMTGMEAMLVAQAQALQTMFVSLMRKGQAQEYMKQYQTHINLALKAQAQSRATIQALVELKYPRHVVITKQANIAHGPQQVNNATETHAHAGETQNEQTKLIKEQAYGAMDIRSTTETIGVDQELETMGRSNRPQNARG
jgi:cellobiose-specific phosphotransferase system component IIB